MPLARGGLLFWDKLTFPVAFRISVKKTQLVRCIKFIGVLSAVAFCLLERREKVFIRPVGADYLGVFDIFAGGYYNKV